MLFDPSVPDVVESRAAVTFEGIALYINIFKLG
jgi:hypothetical protein